MPDMIFINYRREDSAGTAGRLHDRLAQVFGRKDIFMDVDQIPPGIDFVAHLNSQVAACKAFLVVIGPHWLNVKNEAGERRLHQPDDFVAIEIAAALARDIRVIPVLVDGAIIPKASELPDSLKPLVRRQAIDLRQAHFGRDSEALIERLREALGDKAGLGRWRVRALASAAAIAALLLIGVGGYVFFGHVVEQGVQRAELKLDKQRKEQEAAANENMAMASEAEHERQAAQQAEAKRQADEAEQQRLAAVKAEQDRQAKAAQEAEAKRQADQAEQQRLAAIKAEQDRQAKAAQEAEAKRQADLQAEQQRQAALAIKAEQDRQAKAAAEAEAKRLEELPQFAYLNGINYLRHGDYDRAIALFSKAASTDPNSDTFYNRGLAYAQKGDYDRAIADYNEAIRLDPKNAVTFCNRGIAKCKINDRSANADIAQARQLDPSGCR